MRTAMVLAGLALVAGCAPHPATMSAAPMAKAVLRDATGTERGTALVSEAAGSLNLTLRSSGLPIGTHGLHIHAVGKCDAPDFKTAGPHWNPDMKQHGGENPMGAHRGDLANLVVDANGSGTETAPISGTLADLLDADGASIVIHADADDYRTDPSGNSGTRIACGVFVRP